MNNRKFWAFAMIMSLLLTILAGCQSNVASDSGSSASEGTTLSTSNTTVDTAETTDPAETSETEGPPNTDWIATEWSTVFRYDKGEYSCLILLELMLQEDGTGNIVTSDWLVWETQTGFMTDTENASGKDGEVTPCFYTFDGECLSIAYEDRRGNFAVTRSEDGYSITLTGEDSGTAQLFMPVGRILCSSWEEVFDTFRIDCGLFQPNDPQKADSTEATSPADADWILGSWTTVNWNDFGEAGENRIFVTKVTYSFGADGSGTINDCGWNGYPGGEWEVAGMGFVESYFDYTLEGNTLTITDTGNEFEEYPDNERFTRVYNVVRTQDGAMSWEPDGGGMDVVYRQVGSNLSVDALMAAFGWEASTAQP